MNTDGVCRALNRAVAAYDQLPFNSHPLRNNCLTPKKGTKTLNIGVIANPLMNLYPRKGLTGYPRYAGGLSGSVFPKACGWRPPGPNGSVRRGRQEC